MANIGIARSQITGASGTGSGGAGGNWLDVKSFGAKGNATLVFGGMSITSGTNGLSSSTDTPWTLADVGKNIMVSNAGPNGTDLWTTIASFVSSSSVTLTANASTTVPYAAQNFNCAMWGGTDDTTAIQACINAASEQNLGVFFSPGNYIFSATFTLPASGPPPFMFGESSVNSQTSDSTEGAAGAFFIAQNPGIAAYVPFMQWDATGLSCTLSNFGIVGGSYGNLLNSPTPGSMLQLFVQDCIIQNVAIYNNSFQLGFDIFDSGGTILDMFDVSQSRFKFDSTDVLDCSAAGFIITGNPASGLAGGKMTSCVAAGLWPITASFQPDSNFVGNSSVTLDSCSSIGGGTVQIGFDLRTGLLEAINCNVGGCNIGFWLGNYSKVDHCVSSQSGFPDTLVDFLVSVTEVPFAVNAPYFLGEQVIDTNGNYQQVTTAGTSGASVPAWATSGTTTSGTVTFTLIANPGNTAVVGAVIENCNTIAANSGGPAPFGLYDIGSGTTLNQNFLGGIISTPAPQYLQPNTWVRVIGNYTSLVTDEMIFANNSGTVQTITLVTTNKIPGNTTRVKMQGSGQVNVGAQSGLIDGYSQIQMTVQNMSMDFGWDGSNHFIMAVYIPANTASQTMQTDLMQQLITEIRTLRQEFEDNIDDLGNPILFEEDAGLSLMGPS